MNDKKNILNVFLISSDWKYHHRKNFIRSVAKNIGEVLVIQSPVSLVINLFLKFKERFIGYFAGDYKPGIIENEIYSFTPLIVFHITLWINCSVIAYLDSFIYSYQINRFIKRKYSGKKIYLWVYAPQHRYLLGRLKYEKLLYDYCDDLEYDYDGNRIEKQKLLNEILVPECDYVFTVSELTMQRMIKLNKNSYRIYNGYNPDVFSQNKVFEKTVLDEIKKPILGYHGPITALIDIVLVERLLNETDAVIVFIGYIDRNGTEYYKKLRDYENFIHLDYISIDKIANYVSKFTVGIIPLKINDFLSGAFPNKFFEFLAMGKPIVTTAVPELKEFNNIIKYSSSIDEFINNCMELIHNNEQFHGLDKDFLKKYTWDSIVKLIGEKII
jgi:glycosyltransferase involved in cell wall biosynthesis